MKKFLAFVFLNFKKIWNKKRIKKEKRNELYISINSSIDIKKFNRRYIQDPISELNVFIQLDSPRTHPHRHHRPLGHY